MYIKLIIYPLVLDSWDWNLNLIQVEQEKPSRIQIMLSPQSQVGLEPVLEGLQGLWLPMGLSKYKGLRSCISTLWSSTSALIPRTAGPQAGGHKAPWGFLPAPPPTAPCRALRETQKGLSLPCHTAWDYRKPQKHHWNLVTRHKQKGLIKRTRSVKSILQPQFILVLFSDLRSPAQVSKHFRRKCIFGIMSPHQLGNCERLCEWPQHWHTGIPGIRKYNLCHQKHEHQEGCEKRVYNYKEKKDTQRKQLFLSPHLYLKFVSY